MDPEKFSRDKKRGGEDPMHFLVALLCEFKRKFEFFRWRVGVFNYYVFVCMCSLIYKEGVLTSRFKKTLDSKLKDKLIEKFFLTQIFSEKGRGLGFFFQVQVIIFSIGKFIPNLYTLKKNLICWMVYKGYNIQELQGNCCNVICNC